MILQIWWYKEINKLILWLYAKKRNLFISIPSHTKAYKFCFVQAEVESHPRLERGLPKWRTSPKAANQLINQIIYPSLTTARHNVRQVYARVIIVDQRNLLQNNLTAIIPSLLCELYVLVMRQVWIEKWWPASWQRPFWDSTSSQVFFLF
jgi:hypothetical protein